MKVQYFFALCSAFAVFFTACQPKGGEESSRTNNRYPTGQTQTDVMPTPTPTPVPYQEDQDFTATPTPSPEASPVAAGRDLPYGTPVPGQLGFVTSPHDPTAGLVDVRGFAPGQEVRCPYTGKTFLVP